MYIKLEINLFHIEDLTITDIVRMVQRTLDARFNPPYDGDVEVKVIEHSGVNCGDPHCEGPIEGNMSHES